MGRQEDVYVIHAEDILDSRDASAGRPGPRAVSSEGEEGRTASRTRRGMTFRTNPRALIASTLSLFVCGAGQAYNGQVKLGILMFLTEVLAASAHWSVVKLWPSVKELGHIFAVGEWEIFLFLAVADFLLIFFLLYNVAQAYHQAEMEGDSFQGFRRPILAGMASLVIPGWGQLLNAQLGKAIFFLFCLLTEVYVSTLLLLSPFFRLAADLNLDRLYPRRATLVGLGLVFFGAVVWTLSVYDAFLVARYRRRA
jgi:TM2 domain-containing membrane protein YozV